MGELIAIGTRMKGKVPAIKAVQPGTSKLITKSKQPAILTGGAAKIYFGDFLRTKTKRPEGSPRSG